MSALVELVAPEEAAVRIDALRNPFSFARESLTLAPGPTITELLAEIGVRQPVRVWVGDVEIWPDWFARVRPKRGSVVTVRAVARGGNSRQGKNIGTIVAGLLLIIAGVVVGLAAGFSYQWYGIYPAWSLIALGGSLLISGVANMLIPVPKPKRPGMAGIVGSGAQPESPALSISGQTNQIRRYSVVPRVIGRHRVTPPYAALPFTEMVGADQYLRLLFCLTYGPCTLSELKIGDTPLENFQFVETEFIQGAPGQPQSTLYAVDVFEDPFTVLLTQAGGGQIRTSQLGAAELSADFAFPEGLIQFDAEGQKFNTSVTYTLDYRLVGQTAFVPVPGSPFTITEARQGLVRTGHRWKPQRPAGPFGAAAWTQLGFASVTLSRFNDAVLNVIAFDADSAAAGSWIELDPGAPAEFGRVVVTSAGTGANCTWDIQGSDDHVTWTTYRTGFSTGAAGTESVEWPAAKARYWRLLKTNGATAGPDYYEIEFWQTTVGGQYDVRPTRVTADSADALLKNALVWTALRTIGTTPPVLMDNVSLLAMRIKATDQLNGVVDNFNCIVEALVKDYATYAGSVLADAPLVYLRLGEILGAPTAFDASGHGRSAPYIGSPTLGSTGLLIGDAATSMLCDGTDDQVGTVVGSTAIDMGNSSFTIECVVKATNLTGNRGIMHKGDGLEFASNHLGWSLIRVGGVFRFTRAVGSGAPTLVDSPTISAGTTYHVAVIYDRVANTARMVVNGSPSAPVSMPAAAYADFYALTLCQASDDPWQGNLQEVAVYPTALSTARVAAHAAAALGTREWTVQRTSNPAAYFRDYFQYGGNARPVADGRLDLTELQAWHAENSIGGRSVNAVIDYDTALFELLRDVVTPCGRATFTMNDDKYAPLRDLPQTVPAQLFTPRNSRGWNGQRVLPEAAHAVKVRFTNPAIGWQQDERIVYDDGYSAAGEVPGTVPATRFAVLELNGCTDPDLAWRMGRYHIAVTRLRPEVFSIETDIEALKCRRGDLVYLENDVVEFGLGRGRIKSVATSGPNATAITTDEAFPMLAGTSYGVRIRLADGVQKQAAVVTVAGEQTTLTFTSPMTPPIPAVGDLVTFGVFGQESVPALVASIRPAPDFMARLSLVDYAPGVQNADQGVIPPYESHITIQAPLERVPPTPIVDSVISDETVLLRDLDGSLRSRIVIGLHYLATSNVQADFVEVRWRRTGSALPFESLPHLPPNVDVLAVPGVEDEVAYDIRIRSVTRDGLTSPWTEILNHTVVGKSSPPIAPVNLRFVEGTLRWDYPTPPLDLKGFVVRASAGATGNWQTAIALHVGVAGATPFPLPTMYGQWTFLVAARDTSENDSTPASLTIDFGDVRLHNQVAFKDYDADGYPGSITNGSVSAGDLKADQLSTGFWTQDGNLFWSASGATLFWAGTYKEMTYLFSYTTGSNAAGTTMFFDTTIVASAWQLYYRVGTSGDYLPWQGSLTGVLASQQYDFKLVTAAGTVQGVVSRLTLYLDAEDITEHQAGFATAVTTGTRLTLQNTFRSIKQVKPTVVANGGETAITAIAADKQNTAGAGNGPLIKSYDAAGAVVAGHVDVDIVGY